MKRGVATRLHSERMEEVLRTSFGWFLSDLWDRAPKDLHRRHSLFKGVFPIPQRKPNKEMGQLDRKITGVTCGLEPLAA